MTSEEIFKTMQDLIAEQFAVNADDVTMNRTCFNLLACVQIS